MGLYTWWYPNQSGNTYMTLAFQSSETPKDTFHVQNLMRQSSVVLSALVHRIRRRWNDPGPGAERALKAEIMRREAEARSDRLLKLHKLQMCCKRRLFCVAKPILCKMLPKLASL